jgi:hypothetical protein
MDIDHEDAFFNEQPSCPIESEKAQNFNRFLKRQRTIQTRVPLELDEDFFDNPCSIGSDYVQSPNTNVGADDDFFYKEPEENEICDNRGSLYKKLDYFGSP